MADVEKREGFRLYEKERVCIGKRLSSISRIISRR